MKSTKIADSLLFRRVSHPAGNFRELHCRREQTGMVRTGRRLECLEVIGSDFVDLEGPQRRKRDIVNNN
jgi:hypothetical protein